MEKIADRFELAREQSIPEYNTLARFYRHIKTGAQILSLINNDENKVFGIAFRTPPKNSTGVAHILEHSVLCGSRKYPVKEPFVELLKGSLKTFLNAFTYPDKTCYPVASQNVKDFYNLVDVYLDAVFYPRITPRVFEQEGWHLELDSPEAPLAFKGVVYNEMKGAYSSPDNLLAEYSQQSLFPDNTYGLDSGGSPREIPQLSYHEFKAFHERYYHPSNARIFFYGDDNPDDRLRIIDSYLADFEHQEVDSSIQLQPPFQSSRRLTRYFASGDERNEKIEDGAKGMLTVNWVLAEATDQELNLSLKVLEYILLGMPGSPLRKALIDSGLGEDLAGVGLEDDLMQTYFSTGLKGMNIENTDRVEALIFDTLKNLAGEGIDPGAVEAALNSIEFRLRENNSGSYPQGLLLMLRSLSSWLYDADPIDPIAFESPLSTLKARIASEGPSYFSEIIDRIFIQNPHRTTLVMKPAPTLAEKENAEERARLEKIRQGMKPEDIEKIIDNTRELRELQQAPDPPEALATIPSLSRSDLDPNNKQIPLALIDHDGARILYHDIFTNGITYLDLGFNLHLLPQKYLPYVALFGRALVEIGTEHEDYVALSQRISKKTGGIRPEIFSSAIDGSARSAAWLFLRGRSMIAQTKDLLEIVRDLLLSVKFDNRERFRQMVLEEKAKHEQRLIPNGHQIVNMRLRAHFSEADWAVEQMNGVSYLFFLRKLARLVEDNWGEVLGDLESIRQALITRNSMIYNVTIDGSNWNHIEGKLSDFLNGIPARSSNSDSVVDWTPDLPSAFEGMTIPSLVNYVGKAANLFELGYKFHGSSLVISNYLRTSWLWERIRVQGGAYGAFCHFDRHSGTFAFLSYRDPNLLQTIDAFDRSGEFLETAMLSEEEITKGVIGTIGNIDTYLLPDARGYTSMLRLLRNDTEESRDAMRQEVLSTTASDFRHFADILDEVKDQGIVKVLGSQQAIEGVESVRPGWLKTVTVL